MTAAERLMDLAAAIDTPRGQVITCDSKHVEGVVWDDFTLARCKVALDLKRRGPAFVLRAIMEEWPVNRIVRELY